MYVMVQEKKSFGFRIYQLFFMDPGLPLKHYTGATNAKTLQRPHSEWPAVKGAFNSGLYNKN